MSIYDLSLLIGSVLVGLISYRNPRALIWIGAAQLDFWVTTFYWRTGWPYGELFTGCCDASVCMAIYFIGRQRWEMWLWRLFQTSVAISFIYLAANIHVLPGMTISEDAYSIGLELVNWLALLVIIGTAIGQTIGASDVVALRPWNRLRDFALALRAKRATTPFHQVR